jgi:hypothetical protein
MSYVVEALFVDSKLQGYAVYDPRSYVPALAPRRYFSPDELAQAKKYCDQMNKPLPVVTKAIVYP